MGFIDKEVKKQVARKLDDEIKLGGFVEKIDGVIFRVFVEIIDKVIKKPEHQALVLSGIEAFLEEE